MVNQERKLERLVIYEFQEANSDIAHAASNQFRSLDVVTAADPSQLGQMVKSFRGPSFLYIEAAGSQSRIYAQGEELSLSGNRAVPDAPVFARSDGYYGLILDDNRGSTDLKTLYEQSWKDGHFDAESYQRALWGFAYDKLGIIPAPEQDILEFKAGIRTAQTHDIRAIELAYRDYVIRLIQNSRTPAHYNIGIFQGLISHYFPSFPEGGDTWEGILSAIDSKVRCGATHRDHFFNVEKQDDGYIAIVN